MRLNSSFLSVKLSALFHSNCPTHTRTTDTAQLDSIDRVETIYWILLSTRGRLRGLYCVPLVYHYTHLAGKVKQKIKNFFRQNAQRWGWGFGNFDESHNPNLPALETNLHEMIFSKSSLPRNEFFKITSLPYSFRIPKFDNQSINML